MKNVSRLFLCLSMVVVAQLAALGQNPVVPSALALDSGRSATSQVTSSTSLDTTFTVLPTIEQNTLGTQYSIYGFGKQTLGLILVCIDSSTGKFVPNCDLQLTWRAQPGSGSHLHNDPPRPKSHFEDTQQDSEVQRVSGSFACISSAPACIDDPFTITGNSGADGLQMRIRYTAGTYAGVVEGQLLNFLNGVPEGVSLFTIGVQLPILTEMPILVTPQIQVDYFSSGHGDNDKYGLLFTNLELLGIGDEYAIQVIDTLHVTLADVPQLKISAMNLPNGGAFDVSTNPLTGDIDNPWGEHPHAFHRMGTEADISISQFQRVSNSTLDYRRFLARAVATQGFCYPVSFESPDNAKDHWHIRHEIGIPGECPHGIPSAQ